MSERFDVLMPERARADVVMFDGSTVERASAVSEHQASEHQASNGGVIPVRDGADQKAARYGRLLRVAGDAAWNMALDEALLNASVLNASVPKDSLPDDDAAQHAVILRLYGWRGPAVSLGRYQDAARSLDLAVCAEQGIEVVRRPTGGRAVYHESDLTYSLIFPESLIGDGSVLTSYRRLSVVLAAALTRTGLLLQEGIQPAPDRRSRVDCFAHACAADLIVEDSKIVGSAQVRRAGWVLQQGSIRLWPMQVPSGVFTSHEMPGRAILRPPERSQVEGRLCEELVRFFGVVWKMTELSLDESSAADQLAVGKYSTPEWNLCGRTSDSSQSLASV